MKTLGSFKNSVNIYHVTRRNISEDLNLQLLCYSSCHKLGYFYIPSNLFKGKLWHSSRCVSWG